MLYRPERPPLISRVGELTVGGVFVGLSLLAMAGWVYLLGWMAVKFLVWSFS